MIRRIAAMALALALMGACGRHPVLQNESRVSWGHMPASTTYLIRVPDGGTINVCGFDLPDLKWAIQVWGDAIGFSYSIHESCDPEVAHVVSYGPGDATKFEDCAGPSVNGGFTRAGRPAQIVNCGAWNTGERFLLHETGHLFGMCDQYGRYSTDKSECVNTVRLDSDSVMASANRTNLSQDDIDGIQALRRQIWGK